MPLTGEEKKTYMRDYNRKLREGREQVEAEQAKAAEALTSGDSSQYYKAEARTRAELIKVFYGTAIQPEQKDDEEVKKKKSVKKPLVFPAKSKIFGKVLTFDEWLDLRDRSRKNGLWLGREALKKDFLPHVHQVIFDQFVQKNFDGVYHEGYTLGNVHDAIRSHRKTRARELMLLDPRGFYKSTADGVDAVQWMLNVPDIRILIMTGESTLGEAFLKEIKDYFYLAAGAEPTNFHLLFPEYILTGRNGTSLQNLKCPARRLNQKEDTLWVNSIDSNLSGWHCDIMKGDDVVTDANSKNKTTRKGLKEKYDGTKNLVDEWGFIDHIGTRYYTDDWYGTRLLIQEKVPLKYFRRQCWTVKSEFRINPETSKPFSLKQLQEHMVDLTFSEKATWSDLQEKLHESEKSFQNQQLNDPTDADEEEDFIVKFDEQMLLKTTVSILATRPAGRVVIVWDWALTDGKQSDFSVGVAGLLYPMENGEEGMTILEVDVGKWKPTELAYHIVMLARKYPGAEFSAIEQSPFHEELNYHISLQAAKYQVTFVRRWKVMDRTRHAKTNRISDLQILMTRGLLKFIGGHWIDETYRQFIQYTSDPRNKNRGRKDDIPDAISLLNYYRRKGIASDTDKELKVQDEVAVRRQIYSTYFGSDSIVRDPSPTAEAPASNDPRAKYGIPGLRFGR